MTLHFAYSTDNPDTLTAYRQARADRNIMGKRIHDDAIALGATGRAMVRSSAFPGSPDRITGLEQKGEHVPEGWRVVRGNLEPKRGKSGDAARQWLAEHQPVDVRHLMEDHGLPRCAWKPGAKEFGWSLCQPTLFEHDDVLWAMYDAEPGTSDSGFDDRRCMWDRRKLSEYHAAREAFDDAQSTAEVPA